MLWPSSLSSPAIVTSAAVRPFPRWLLWVFCVVYVAAGYVGRGPWKAEDITTLGVMLQLADGSSPNWWQPGLFGQALDNPDGALLPYWLGAWLIQWTAPWLDPVWAARVPFVLALSLVLYWTWHSTFQLALLPAAQPVTFAFGGQAAPVDYARALADSSLMALMACLGLAQLSHEASPDLFQLLAVSALLYASSLSARGRTVDRRLTLTWLGGLVTLSLSGRPYWAVLVAITLPVAHWAWANCVPTALHHPQHRPSQESLRQLPHWAWLGMLVTLGLWGVQQWTAAAPNQLWLDEVWRVPQLASFGKLLLWFTWPVWPLVCWTVWHWRRHWMLHHIGIPLAFALGGLVLSVGYGGHDRVLMLALPALATLAAFALPTLSRSLSALIDWFSLLFFSVCAALIWIIWLAMMTGVPAKPAANVARLAPGFVPSFELLDFVVALLGTVAWVGVLYWRTSRAQAVLWKSLVLPATGTLLCWLLLMSVWLPLLDHSRSYAFLTQRLQHLIHTTSTSAIPNDAARCVLMHQLNSAQQAGLVYHITHASRGADRGAGGGSTQIGLHISRPHYPDTTAPACAYGLSHVGTSPPNDGYTWRPLDKLYRLTDNKEGLQLYQRLAPTVTLQLDTFIGKD